MRHPKLLIFATGTGAALLWGLLTRPPPDEVAVPAPADTDAHEVVELTRAEGAWRAEIGLMGSVFVLAVDAEPEVARTALAEAVAHLRALEDRLSSWRPESEISRLNARAGLEPVEVSPDTFALLKASMDLHARTDGAFDVTIGPVWDLWPFRDPTRGIPDDAALAAALALVDGSALVLDEATRTAFLPRPGMRVNLGAIGKGFAAREAAAVLRSHGVERAVVSAGGDVYAVGAKADGPWVVGVEHPRWKGRMMETFPLRDASVATSGDTHRHVAHEGRRLSHILDPRSGRPVEGIWSVSVLTADPVEADAFATAVSVMGPVDGMAWVEAQPDVEALIVDDEGRPHRSSGWAAATRSDAAPAPIRAATPSAPPAPAPPTRSTPLRREVPEADRARKGTTRMVDVPAGAFLAGEAGVSTSLPRYRIDRTEVTNAQYATFLADVRAHGHVACHPDEPAGKDHTPRYWRDGWRPALLAALPGARLAPFDDASFRAAEDPVVGVDWWDAHAYAGWAGKRLPTRLEWERAARGTDGRPWPWGQVWDAARVNAGGEKWGERDGHVYAAPADSFPQGASPAGALHLAGNVAEWTEEGLVMGGSSRSNPSQVLAWSGELQDPAHRAFDVGFRCARSGAP